MIPRNFVEQWQDYAPWQSLAMVEQDLVLSRALINLYNNPKIKEFLIFRGGTALNKLFLKTAHRYSEDIDLVQRKPEPIGDTINAIRKSLYDWLGDPIIKQTKRSVKLIYRYTSLDNTPAKLKIEINTVEHFQIKKLQISKYSIASEWYNDGSDIVTYNIDELIATKLRALYQRRKGRDLFDLWLTFSKGLVDRKRVIEIFQEYCTREGNKISRSLFEKNLNLKRENRDFKIDMDALLPHSISWNFDEAFNYVQKNIISYIP